MSGSCVWPLLLFNHGRTKDAARPALTTEAGLRIDLDSSAHVEQRLRSVANPYVSLLAQLAIDEVCDVDEKLGAMFHVPRERCESRWFLRDFEDLEHVDAVATTALVDFLPPGVRKHGRGFPKCEGRAAGVSYARDVRQDGAVGRRAEVSWTDELRASRECPQSQRRTRRLSS